MRKNSGSDRRTLTRNTASMEVEFHVWNAAEKRPLTKKVPARLTNISSKGACLQTNQTIIDGYHLMLHDDVEGGTPLVLDFPPSPDGTSLTVKAQVLWYNRFPAEEKFRFNVGLKFMDFSPTERKQLESLIKSAFTEAKG
jgi:hypothetical protein